MSKHQPGVVGGQ